MDCFLLRHAEPMTDADHATTAVAWARRRAAGEYVAAIAAEVGCAPITVYRATRPYGPFLQPQQARRYALTDPHSNDWIRRRRDGESVATIAARDEVSEHRVRDATRAYGPYPRARRRPSVIVDEETIDRWVAARRAGHTLAAIAQSAGVRPRVVRAATAPSGPFDAAEGHGDLLGVNAVAQQLGMRSSTIIQWRTAGFLPPATARTPRGHDLWDSTVIAIWADQVRLPVCSQCGARPKDLDRHVRMLHRHPSKT